MIVLVQKVYRFACRRNSSTAGGAKYRLISDTRGDALVEAVILFPIMMMVFAALVMLAIYMPSQAALQQSTQYAATALATQISDTWLMFDTESMSYDRAGNKYELPGVYESIFSTSRVDISIDGAKITAAMESRSMSVRNGELKVICRLNNVIIYKEIIVEAFLRYEMPVTLAIIGFPEEIILTASSAAVVQNGDEFIRNMDIAADFVSYAIEKLGLSDITESFDSIGDEVKDILGWQE